MTEKFRKWSGRFLFVLALFFIFLYLLVCLVPFINAGSLWFVAVLGLAFPVLFVIVIICGLVWLLKKSKWAFLPLIALLLSWKQISVAFGFHFFGGSFKEVKSANSVRVLTWNVFRWDEQNKKARGGESYRKRMMEAVVKEQADILCFQEFFQPYNSKRFEGNLEELKEMGYPYSYFFPSSSLLKGELKFGMAILSKYPITDSAKFSFGQTPHSEGLMFADIKVREKTYRVFSVHMESSRMGKKDYFGGAGQDGSLSKVKSSVSNLKRAYHYRSEQAKLVRSQIDQSPYPVIVCGNIGDVPNSNAYFTVRKDLKDAFLEKGAGFGATFRFISPTLRLDCILADPELEVEQFERPLLSYSDHYPLVADLTERVRR
jgi:endonuclease/exonuclease/phosphatase family metal-dependent hydrolase